MNALKLFRLLLRLYPRGFRERFGEELEQTFKTDLRQASQQSHLFGFWIGTFGDMSLSLLRENLGGSPLIRVAIGAGWVLVFSLLCIGYVILRAPLYYPIVYGVIVIAWTLLMLGVYGYGRKTVVDRMGMAGWLIFFVYGMLSIVPDLLVMYEHKHGFDPSRYQLENTIQQFVNSSSLWMRGLLIISTLAFAWSNFRFRHNQLIVLGLVLFALLHLLGWLWLYLIGSQIYSSAISIVVAIVFVVLIFPVGLITLGLTRSQTQTPQVPRGST